MTIEHTYELVKNSLKLQLNDMYDDPNDHFERGVVYKPLQRPRFSIRKLMDDLNLEFHSNSPLFEVLWLLQDECLINDISPKGNWGITTDARGEETCSIGCFIEAYRL